ncbi:MAG: bifunctional oligoribonuclease/PAP phosphatase NrnA [bacterium]|nr:bifunctional oligoribonuclease/PAP phosphatase NrnA [bacterium]
MNLKDHKAEIEQILELLRSKETFVLTSHVNPDGDGLGSELALHRVLNELNKNVRIINDSPLPPNMRFLDPDGTKFEVYTKDDDEFIINADVIIVLDISVMHRLGKIGEIIGNSSSTKVCIDHHSTNSFPGDILYIDEEAVATGELVYYLFVHSDLEIDKTIAEALYVSIIADTGNFRFSNTNARIMRVCSNLLDAGINHNQVYRKMFESNSWGKILLFSKVLGTLSKEYDGKIACMYLTPDMLKETGTDLTDVEGFSEYPRNIKDVLVSVLITEQENNSVKLSFRSVSGVRVDIVASEFGGGGHKNASAAMIENMSLNEAITKVLETIKSYLLENNL